MTQEFSGAKDRSPHRFHDLILGSADRLVGEKGIRRFPLNNVVVTSPTVAEKVLARDGSESSKTTALNDVVGNIVGGGSLLSSEMSHDPAATVEIRSSMIEYFRRNGHRYLETIREFGTILCDNISSQRGIKDLYSHVHAVYIAALVRSFGSTDGIDISQIQREVVNTSAEAGIKSLIGIIAGEAIVSPAFGSGDQRRREILKWVNGVVEDNRGIWDLDEDGRLNQQVMEANLITLLGAGTTSPAGVFCWTIYDAARNDEDRALITGGGSKRDLTYLMAKTMGRHPFGFVINRGVNQDFTIDDFQFSRGDTVWLLTIPGKGNLIDPNDMFGIGFGNGSRNCLGKHIAIGSHLNLLGTWGKYFKDWTTSEPYCPLYYTTLKPKGMDITIKT